MRKCIAAPSSCKTCCHLEHHLRRHQYPNFQHCELHLQLWFTLQSNVIAEWRKCNFKIIFFFSLHPQWELQLKSFVSTTIKSTFRHTQNVHYTLTALSNNIIIYLCWSQLMQTMYKPTQIGFLHILPCNMISICGGIEFGTTVKLKHFISKRLLQMLNFASWQITSKLTWTVVGQRHQNTRGQKRYHCISMLKDYNKELQLPASRSVADKNLNACTKHPNMRRLTFGETMSLTNLSGLSCELMPFNSPE